MAVVLEAEHIKLGHKVALKVLHAALAGEPSVVSRFEREGRALSKLRSPNVVRVFDVDATPAGAPFLVMEYLEGGDLEMELRRRGALPIGEAVGYALQACAAMQEAHERGIVHRDLKPTNLFLADGGAEPGRSRSSISASPPTRRSRARRASRGRRASWGRRCTWRPSSSGPRRTSTRARTFGRSARRSTSFSRAAPRSSARRRRSASRSSATPYAPSRRCAPMFRQRSGRSSFARSRRTATGASRRWRRSPRRCAPSAKGWSSRRPRRRTRLTRWRRYGARTRSSKRGGPLPPRNGASRPRASRARRPPRP